MQAYLNAGLDTGLLYPANVAIDGISGEGEEDQGFSLVVRICAVWLESRLVGSVHGLVFFLVAMAIGLLFPPPVPLGIAGLICRSILSFCPGLRLGRLALRRRP